MKKKKWYQGWFASSTNETIDEITPEDNQSAKNEQPNSSYSGNTYYGQWQPVINQHWDGEKTPGELGAITRNIPDHLRLRYRSYDAADKIDIVQTISGKFFKYIIGSGLKLQSEPNTKALSLEGINEDLTDFKQNVEARFQVWANSKLCSNSGMLDLHDLGLNGFTTKFFGGDFLVITRVKNKNLTIQVIDGEHVQTPHFDSELLQGVKDRGNFVEHGIEYDSNCEHVGFFVKVKDVDSIFGKMQYIPAKGEKTKRVVAWMVYGRKQRPDQFRGIPETTAILEKVNKLDRYTEAAVGKAEEAANLFMAVQHDISSTGEDPFAKQTARKLNQEAGQTESSYVLADGLTNKINQTTSKTMVNLPIGAELKSFQTDIESNYSEFHGTNFDSVCSSVDLPPEVAMQKYDSNYSASRAATGAWEFISDIHREKYSKDFYKPIFKRWLEIEVLKNKIEAPGFIQALNSNDQFIIEAYSNCRFTGKKVPHIDPIKEVKAARAILGDETTPFASFEKVVEGLNLGDWMENFKKYLLEKEFIDENTPEPIPTEPIKKQ